MRLQRIGLLAAGLLALAGSWTPAAGDGLYLRAALGANVARGLTLSTVDNDRAARCDEFVNPRYAEVAACTTPNRGAGAVDAWTSEFDAAQGLLAGIALGQRFGERLRVEFEYAYRAARYAQASPIIAPSGTAYTELFGPELPVAEERVDDLTAHQLFANVYLDLPNASRFTPFVGAGAGVGLTAVDYGALWFRNIDPDTVRTAAGLPNEDEVRRNLAGTASVTRDVLTDTLAGYQVLGGVDYAVSESVSLGVLARWAGFGGFRDGGNSYVQLRSHPSNVRLDGSEPVVYEVRTDDIGFVAVNLSLTVGF